MGYKEQGIVNTYKDNALIGSILDEPQNQVPECMYWYFYDSGDWGVGCCEFTEVACNLEKCYLIKLTRQGSGNEKS